LRTVDVFLTELVINDADASLMGLIFDPGGVLCPDPDPALVDATSAVRFARFDCPSLVSGDDADSPRARFPSPSLRLSDLNNFMALPIKLVEFRRSSPECLYIPYEPTRQ
jgi:hypothetical protein